MFYKPKYFHTTELVDKNTYLKFGDDALMFINPLLLITLDGVREILDVPIIINNWKKNGQYQWSGLRTRDCDIGAEYSQHRLGNAADIKPVRMSIGDAFIAILNHKDDEKIKYLTCLENPEFTPTWLHVDCRNISDRVRIVKP